MNKIVVVCIGTSKVVGDSVGPIVGEMLCASDADICVYGNMQKQINALNIKEYCQKLNKYHKDDIIIAVDSALGRTENIGKVRIVGGGIKPGGAFCDFHQRIGDIGIMAVVGQSDGDRMLELNNRSFSFIFNLAVKIVKLIKEVVNDCLRESGKFL